MKTALLSIGLALTSLPVLANPLTSPQNYKWTKVYDNLETKGSVYIIRGEPYASIRPVYVYFNVPNKPPTKAQFTFFCDESYFRIDYMTDESNKAVRIDKTYNVATEDPLIALLRNQSCRN